MNTQREKELGSRYGEALRQARQIKDKAERKAAIKAATEIYKRDNPVQIDGEYLGSHKAIPEHIKYFTMLAHADGIDLFRGGPFNKRKELLTTVPWTSIKDFSYTENQQSNESGRVTLTRAAAFGIFALGMKKKKVDSKLELISTLKTKSGDIVLEYKSHIDNTKSTSGSIINAADNSLIPANQKFRISVIAHTNEKSEKIEI